MFDTPVEAASDAKAPAGWEHVKLEGVQLTGMSQDFFSQSESVLLQFTNKVTWSYISLPPGPFTPMTYAAEYYLGGSGTLFPPATMNPAIAIGTNSEAIVSWFGVSGLAYNLLGSSGIAGPYGIEGASFAPSSTGTISTNVSTALPSFFYQVQLGLDYP